MKYYFLSVDIGLSGAMSLISDSKELIACETIPVISVLVNKKMRNQYDISSINAILKAWMSDYNIVKIGFERLRAIPGQASQVAFSMGGGTMLFKTLATVHKIPFVEIEARSWQKKIFGELGIQYTGKTTKQASIQAAKQLFPGFNFKRTERCKVASSDMTDSACIGLYILSNN